ncbi:response regulator [Winogradskyella sp. PC-19]|uniref:DNA-binding response regulator n=1 Tax=Winogradskyella sp. PC-19 TaxID=754417 RepID=UPI000B3C7244|nr:response regulator [Winogradskyella sp. PC-19]ARV08193.1 response regulator [Winogradskyella sp. PC-19]
MFKKVLIVDDHDDINTSVFNILKANDVSNIINSQYCDDAFLKIKRAKYDNEPYDLLITDLSFKKDHRNCDITSGEDLIAALRKDFPNLSIIIYSMKDQLQKVRLLVKNYKVNAYVCKDRNGSKELAEAIKLVYNNESFLSPQVANAINSKLDLEITDYDIELTKQLSLGLDQKGISRYFIENNISPGSVSSIEKRLNNLRIKFKADNAIHLVAKMKDLGLI